MKTLRQAAILKAVEGVTTLDEIDRVIADEAVQGGRS
jgi:type II secretory ATPase GspE/PulE/Tfp pilus assembly ATPase PilB-like protein